MTYPILAFAFFFSALLAIIGMIYFTVLAVRGRRARSWIKTFYMMWFGPYALFFFFLCGPRSLQAYPPAGDSPYRLPWKAGVRRLVVQGNHSFTSHRDFHEHAWDFLMPNGTDVLASRAGRVVEVEDQWDGIGIKSNFLDIEHADGTRARYAHIRRGSAKVKPGEEVRQGQPIAESGMVGQTIYPHLHFLVIGRDGSGSIPISFSDAPGVPLAGHFYTSGNTVSPEEANN